MVKNLRHVGKLASTDSRCVVVMLQIPNRFDHALVVEVDSLPDKWQQAVVDLLEGQEGQGVENFSDALAKRYMADTGKSVLQSLHEGGVLKAVPVDQVLMVPSPGNVYPLRKILESMGKYVGPNVNGNNVTEGIVADAVVNTEIEKAVVNDPNNDPAITKFNPHANNAAGLKKDDAERMARGLMLQGDLMLSEAKSFYEKAYQAAPWLRPSEGNPITAMAQANRETSKKNFNPETGRPVKPKKDTTKKVLTTEEVMAAKKANG